MEEVRQFLELSSIHGLHHVATSKKCNRLFWILAVFGGFSCAVYLIHSSFSSWNQSPITSTVETLSISQITFPKVTVCPPKNSFLNLNYAIKQSEKIIIHNDDRKELFHFARDVIQVNFFNELMKNMSMLEDPDRYYNWYHGVTQIRYPFYKNTNDFKYLDYYIGTSATSGNITTQHFGKNFDSEKVEGKIYFHIELHIPPSVIDNENVTLMFDLQKNTIMDYSRFDRLTHNDFYDGTFDAHLKHWSKNYTGPKPNGKYIRNKNLHWFRLRREMSNDDIGNVEMELMPGFNIMWSYDTPIEKWAPYSGLNKTKEFVRCV